MNLEQKNKGRKPVSTPNTSQSGGTRKEEGRKPVTIPKTSRKNGVTKK